MENVNFIKNAFIKKLPNGKYRVLSQKGKNLGTYSTKELAKKRLKQIEMFKHLKKIKASPIDLTSIESLSLSAIMREINKKDPKKALMFLQTFKNNFDKLIKSKEHNLEEKALEKSIIDFSKDNELKINKKLIKNADISEIGNAKSVANHMAHTIKFFLMRLKPESRAAAIKKIKEKIYNFSEVELAEKKMPASSAIGQAISFVKITLFNNNPTYIRDVINNLIGVL